MLTVYKDNRSPSVDDVIRIGGTPVVLSAGSAVRFRMRDERADTLDVDQPALITSVTAGTVRYDWQPADLDNPGPKVAWWRVTLPSGKVQDTDTFPIVVVDHVASAAAHAPTLAEVAQFVDARTKDENGRYIGTFTEHTRPTASQVQSLITRSADWVGDRLGGTVATELVVPARDVAALRTAMMIELSYFGDQIRANRSPYDELKALHDEAWAALLEARKDLGADQLAGTDDDLSPSGLPVFSFPSEPYCRAPGSESPWPSVCGSVW